MNNAGIYGPSKDAQSLALVASDTMLEVFNVDCVGPLRVVKHLRRRLIAEQGVIANISSKMGSNAGSRSLLSDEIHIRHTQPDWVSRKACKQWIPAFAGMTKK